jgi:hypothetical protein
MQGPLPGTTQAPGTGPRVPQPEPQVLPAAKPPGAAAPKRVSATQPSTAASASAAASAASKGAAAVSRADAGAVSEVLTCGCRDAPSAATALATVVAQGGCGANNNVLPSECTHGGWATVSECIRCSMWRLNGMGLANQWSHKDLLLLCWYALYAVHLQSRHLPHLAHSVRPWQVLPTVGNHLY